MLQYTSVSNVIVLDCMDNLGHVQQQNVLPPACKCSWIETSEAANHNVGRSRDYLNDPLLR